MAITKVSSELIKDNSITMDKMHTGVILTTSEGLHNNANDTVLPTAGAVAAYVTSQVTGADNWDLSFAWGDHSTYGYATETYVDNSIANVINSAPATLDTLNELAAALGDDPNFATTVSTQIGTAQSTANTALTNANAALAKDPTLTLSGDASGSATFTNLGNATLSVTIADDSHNHIISNIDGLQTALDGKQAAGTYNTIIGTDTDINTSGATIVDNIYVTDGVITSMGTRTLTLGDLGYTGATNANYITNNNQLTNGAGYLTSVGNDSHWHSKVYIPDTRGAARLPNYYDDRYAQYDFQNYADTGAGGDTWHVLQTISPWSTYDPNHRQQQLAWTGTGGLKFRYATSDTSWGSWQTLWTSGNDGSGSGLDADLLDGLQGSQFFRSDIGGTISSGVTISGNLTVGSGASSYINMLDSDHGTRAIHNNSNRIGFLTSGSAWGSYCSDNGDWTTDFISYAGASMRAPLFYDSNNTGYYLNPAGQSRLGNIERLSHDGGYFVGSYNSVGANSANTNPIYTIGDNYKPSATSLGNMYGIGYCSAGSAPFVSLSGAASWGMYVAADGDARIFLDASNGVVVSTGSHRAPIFYDSNNTGYYTNPASTSNLNALNVITLTETSALRFKENIKEDIDASIVDKLRPVSYDWKQTKEKDYGFIAEEVNELDEDLVTKNSDGEMSAIKYTKLIPFLVKKIQEQEERIKQLENGKS